MSTPAPAASSPAVLPPDQLTARPGLDLLKDMIAGKIPGPPIAHTLNFTLVEVENGQVVFEGEPQFSFYNPLGTVHGGWTATLLDSAMACAVHSTLAAGQGYTTLEFKLNCVRPITKDTGLVRCEGKVINVGRTIATSEGRLIDSKGRLLAHGTETCLIFSAK
ncbi:MAG TPA: PaaI family thioesterase [Beijerinckiaceae bacterium]|nr:PaaI family thioesterase [Beijerinckiaceae bacterium]